MADRHRMARGNPGVNVLGYVLVFVLAVVAGGLTFFALTADPDVDDPVPVYTPGTLQPNAPLATEPLQPSGRGIVALSDAVGWRFTSGECGVDEPTLEAALDGPASWASIALPEAVVGGAILSADAPEGRVRLTAVSPEQCATGLASAVAFGWSGETWEQVEAAPGWIVDPFSPGALAGPAGSVTPPCAPVDVAAYSGSDLAVLCADQTVVRSNDAGTTWDTPIAVAGAVAVVADTAGYLLAAGHQEACARLAIIALNVAADDSTGAVRGCAPVAYRPEETAMSMTGSTLWIWAGTQDAVSVDGGATWL